MTLKAYAVLENNENTGGIVFAKHAVTARRQGANEYADGEFEYVTCRRAKWADRYAETREVPIAGMIENGWHFECGSCGTRIDSDMLWERDLELEDVIGTNNTGAYCNAVCEARERLYKAEASHVQKRWIRRFRKLVKAKFPDAVIIKGEGIGSSNGAHAYARKSKGRWQIGQCAVSFEFPGMEIAPATLRYDRQSTWPKTDLPNKPYWSCCNGDQATFEAWAKAHKERRALEANLY